MESKIELPQGIDGSKMSKVSVIIPCYNQGRYIDEAVDSVLVQTFSDFEIIVVNDGSTDEFTIDLLNHYQKPQTRIIHTTNQGLASARNNGIKVAQGEYILPLDADDKIGNEYLAEAVNVLDNNSSVGIVYCHAEVLGAPWKKWNLPEFSLEKMLIDNIIFCSSFFRKKDWEQVGGYDPEMVYGWEDYDFWLSLIEKEMQVYRIPKVLFYYREADNSMVRSKSKQQKVEMFSKIFHKHQRLFQKNINIWINKIIDENQEDQQIQKQMRQIGGKDKQLKEKEQKIDQYQIQLDLLQQGLNIEKNSRMEITNSRSWKLTSPLRQISTFLRKGKCKFISFIYHFNRQYKFLRASGLFDKDYYLETYPDVQRSCMDPLVHYITNGAREGRNPCYLFNTSFYLEQNLDLSESDLNPLIHYLQFGVQEGRIPNPMIGSMHYYPRFSIITPVYNVEENLLRQCISSVLHQVYNNLELYLVDDGSSEAHVKDVLEEYCARDHRVKIRFLKENQGIANASNVAVSMARGDFLCFLDNDDMLAPDALYETALLINKYETDVIYTDERIIDGSGGQVGSHFKPDFSPDLLLSHNYITHLTILRKSLFLQVGGFSSEYEGAQDYDLLLKVTEHTSKIHHIPKELYYWRSIETSSSANPEQKSYADDAGKRALEAALKRRNIHGDVFNTDRRFYYHVQRKLAAHPLISIIIPFRDKAEYLQKCIEAILFKSSYPQYEIIGVNNGSKKQQTFDVIQYLKKVDQRVRFYDYNIPFNYSKINNYAVTMAKGEHIVLMNNDIEIINPDWIESLLEHSQRKEVGAVGAKLYFPDSRIQHAGIIIGMGGFVGHSYKYFAKDSPGYLNRLMCIHNVCAVTGALLMVKKRLFESVGGLDEKNLAIALNDVDFCLKLMGKGFINVFTPYCEASHHESVSRGYEETYANQTRFQKETSYFQKKWYDLLDKGDPYFPEAMISAIRLRK